MITLEITRIVVGLIPPEHDRFLPSKSGTESTARSWHSRWASLARMEWRHSHAFFAFVFNVSDPGVRNAGFAFKKQLRGGDDCHEGTWADTFLNEARVETGWEP